MINTNDMTLKELYYHLDIILNLEGDDKEKLKIIQKIAKDINFLETLKQETK